MLDINEKDDLSREIDELHRAKKSQLSFNDYDNFNPDSPEYVTTSEYNEYTGVEEKKVTDTEAYADSSAAYREISDFSDVRSMDDLKQKFIKAQELHQQESVNINLNTAADGEKGKGGKVLGIIFLIIFLGSMLGIVLFASINPNMSIFLFGLVFASVGLFALAPGQASGAKPMLAVFALIGLTIMAISGFLMWGPENAGEIVESKIPLILALGFFIVGVIMIVYPISVKIKRSKIAYTEITAICSDVLSKISYRKTNGRRRRVTMYCPVYTFYYNGVNYTVKENFYSNPCTVQTGDECKLFINPQKPTDFYSTLASGHAILIVLGIVLMVISGIVMFTFLSSPM